MDDTRGSANQLPDLQAILATLAKYTPATSASHQCVTPSSSTAPTPGSLISDRANLLVEQSSLVRQVPQTTRGLQHAAQPKAHLTDSLSSNPIDPSTITTWQEGLRCVTKVAAQDVNFPAGIRKMIADQKAHEMRWFTERQNLKLAQAKRTSFATQTDSIMAKLNPSFVPLPKPSQSNTDKANELAKFDWKVHMAQVSMETTMNGQLKALGVPFFGTDQSLIIGDNVSVDIATQLSHERRPQWSPMIREAKLLQLRRRMIEHLEDLYRD